MLTNRDLTDYLKGLAIIAVIVSHYQTRLFSPEIFKPFGNHFIAIFFILSGYGIYFSLNNLVGASKLEGHHLKIFYIKRAIRLYPLFWLKYLMDLIADPNVQLDYSSILEILLIKYHNPQFAWFLHALTPCYLIAPFLYTIIKKYPKYFIPLMLSVFLVINLIFAYLNIPKVRIWSYKSLYLSHIFLFSFGLLFPYIQEKIKFGGNRAFSFSLFGLMVFSFFQTSNFPLIYTEYETLFNCLFIASTLSFCFYFIQSPTITIASPFLTLLGKYSYSLYLFHGFLFTVLSMAGMIQSDSLYGYIPVILVFPIFFFLCMVAEHSQNNLFDIKKSTDQIIVNIKNAFSKQVQS